MRAIVYSMLLNEEADDVTQLAFCKLDKQIDTEDHAKALVITIAKNMAIDVLRARARERKQIKTFIADMNLTQEATEDNVSFDDAAEAATIHADVLEFIYQEIKKLPPRAREIFELYSLKDMSTKQISEQLGLSVNTVQNHLTIARNKLKIEILFNKKDVLQLLAKRPTL